MTWWSSREFLVHETIIGGVGLADIGADRGACGPSLLCRIEDATGADGAHPVVVSNAMFTGGSSDAAVRESFAESVIGFATPHPDGSFDLSQIATYDFVRIRRQLENAKHTRFRQVPERSFVRSQTWFGEVLTYEAVLTFEPVEPAPFTEPRSEVSPRSAPTSLGSPAPTDTVSVVQQVSFRRPPNPLMEPAEWEPRAGAMPGLVTHDFESIGVRDAPRPLTLRFRQPSADNPIVFFVDPSIPDDIRRDIRAGAGWWAAAFSNAGLPGAFRVEDLPPGQSLHDPNRHVILWTHRADRGWSFGAVHCDPRTGEILRGVVRLGSQRVEQVRAVAEAVLRPFSSDRQDDVRRLVSERIRVLAAHEVGHALGFAHNFASHEHNSLSVMDYPFPHFRVEGTSIVAEGCYVSGLSEWDCALVPALYSDERPVSVLPYVTDADSRAADAADAQGATWVVPGSALSGLAEVCRVRQRALADFDEGVAPPGADRGLLAHRFVVLFLLHRFQVTAVAKLLGGWRRSYARVADRLGGGERVAVPRAEQLAALTSLLDTLRPDFLSIPDELSALLVGPGGGIAPPADSLLSAERPEFDRVTAVRVAAEVTVGAMCAPARLSRIHSQPDGVQVAEVVDAVVAHMSQGQGELWVRETVQLAVLDAWVRAAGSAALSAGAALALGRRVESHRTVLSELWGRAAVDRLVSALTDRVVAPAQLSIPAGAPL